MIDWLKRDPHEQPQITLGDCTLPIAVRRHPSARRIVLRMGQDGREVRVTIPCWMPTHEALKFARSKRDWLIAQLQEIAPAQPLGDGGTIKFRGQPLIVAHDPGARRKPVMHGTTIAAGGPAAGLEARLSRWLKAEAIALMTDDLACYCARLDRPAPKLALSNAKRRWGSCGPDGTIRMNWRLIMAPDFVRRSVVAHEAAHLVHFDHSRAFHALLNDLFECDMDEANGWLKQQGRSLYQTFG